jgi:hypothetical protein
MSKPSPIPADGPGEAGPVPEVLVVPLPLEGGVDVVAVAGELGGPSVPLIETDTSKQ